MGTSERQTYLKAIRSRYRRARKELLSKGVFERFVQAATWSTSVTSIPSLNLIPVITLAR